MFLFAGPGPGTSISVWKNNIKTMLGEVLINWFYEKLLFICAIFDH